MNPSNTIQRKVTFAETDMAGVVHFSNYFKWMEIAEHAFFEKLGIPVIESFREGVAGWPKIDVGCSFEAPLYFQDIVQITLEVKEIRTHSIRYEFSFFKMEKGCKYPVGKGHMTSVFASSNRHEHSLNSIPIADEVRKKISCHTEKKHTNPAMGY